MNVSRETQNKLDLYLDLLRKWNAKINLVSKTTLLEAGKRHFEDSLQVAALAPTFSQTWADFGSGGGFPGAVVAILLQDQAAGIKMTLVESDQRKAAFLRTVSRETQVPMAVVAKRVEDVPSLSSDVVSARALAPLPRLLEFADRHMAPTGTALFMKGATWKEELKVAQNQWRFRWDAHNSVTNPNAVILEIGELSRA
jgi:16S rRNA (guanine527-N7)-methyltransferase